MLQTHFSTPVSKQKPKLLLSHIYAPMKYHHNHTHTKTIMNPNTACGLDTATIPKSLETSNSNWRLTAENCGNYDDGDGSASAGFAKEMIPTTKNQSHIHKCRHRHKPIDSNITAHPAQPQYPSAKPTRAQSIKTMLSVRTRALCRPYVSN